MPAFVQPRLVNASTNVYAKHTQGAPANKPATQPFGMRLLNALLAALAAPNA